MKTTHWVLMAALAFGLACSGEDAEDAAAAVRSTAESAGKMAGEAADAAGEAAEAAGEAADEAMVAAQDAAAKVEQAVSDPVARCTELAAAENWAEALGPCGKAHEAQPDNMAIEHALQQARAAAGQ